MDKPVFSRSPPGITGRFVSDGNYNVKSDIIANVIWIIDIGKEAVKNAKTGRYDGSMHEDQPGKGRSVP
jgi:hypothetical protein